LIAAQRTALPRNGFGSSDFWNRPPSGDRMKTFSLSSTGMKFSSTSRRLTSSPTWRSSASRMTVIHFSVKLSSL